MNVQFIGLSFATACSLLLDTVAKDFISLIDGAWTLFNVLPLTREQVWKRRHDIQLSVDYFQAIYSSQASLLHRKPRHTLLSSLVHYSHDISITTSLTATPYDRYVFHVTGIVRLQSHGNSRRAHNAGNIIVNKLRILKCDKEWYTDNMVICCRIHVSWFIRPYKVLSCKVFLQQFI